MKTAPPSVVFPAIPNPKASCSRLWTRRLSVLVFRTFLRVKSANKVLQFFNEHNLHLPRCHHQRDLVWRRPSVAAILSILKNPAYAGAFVYGRSRTTRHLDGTASTRSLPMAQWKIIVKDKYPAYINWETFERIQAMLKDNYAEYDRNKSRGIPRPGAVLLQGIVYCGKCGQENIEGVRKEVPRKQPPLGNMQKGSAEVFVGPRTTNGSSGYPFNPIWRMQ